MLRPRLILLAKYLSVLGVSLWGAIFLVGQLSETEAENQLSAWIRNGGPLAMTEQTADEMALFDFAMLYPGGWEGKQAFRDMLLARNLDMMKGTYYSMHTIAPWLRRAYERTGTDTYPGRLWDAGSQFIAKTTAGDTAAFYRNYPVYDFTDPEARAAMIEVFVDYIVTEDVDWAMLDYCSNKLPDHRGDPNLWPPFEGDMDLDQNGIGYWDDPGEQFKSKMAWFDYINELRLAVPRGFILIPNGNLALTDTTFARMVDGCYIENFPHWFFGTQDPNWDNALDVNYPGSLHELTRPGRYRRDPGFVFLGTPECRQWAVLANLFDGVVVACNTQDQSVAPVEMEMGAPTGPIVQGELPDGYSLTRGFENGSLTVHVVANRLLVDFE